VNAQTASQPSSNRSRTTVTLVLACCLIVGISALGLGVIGPIGSGQASGGGSHSAGAVLLVCFIAIAFVFRALHHAEHRLRSNTPVAQSYVGAGALGATSKSEIGAGGPSGLPAPGAFAFGRTYSPASLGGGTSFCVILVVVSLLIGIPHYIEAKRSNFVQKHGTIANATVLGVDNLQYCSNRGGCSWTARIRVTLAPPVDGVSASVIHYPHRSLLSDGEHVRALVDPREPSYAELPGIPLGTTWGWVLPLLLAVAGVGFGVFQALGLIHLQGHRREHSGLATPATGLASQSA
jgi:hypothetical protein